MHFLVRRAADPVLVVVLTAAVLAGCSAPNGAGEKAVAQASGDTTAAVRHTPPAEPAAVPQGPSDPGLTVGGDGSAIRLSALSAADIEGGGLSGELGCSFSTPEASPLLLAMGTVASREPAQGLVKVGDHVEPVSAPGGFDAMLKGATFQGKGKTVRVVVTGPPVAGGESPARPATLTYDRADGARRTFQGRWECGP